MTAQKLDRNGIIEIYKEHLTADFPKDEVKPLSSILKGLDNGVYDAYALYDGETLCAYAYFIIDGKNRLLDYYAVVRGLRDGGIGSKFLGILKTKLKNSTDLIVIESENPDMAQTKEQKITRERRIAFYLKNGLSMTDCHARVFGVDYNILVLPLDGDTSFTPEKYLNIYKKLLSKRQFEDNILIVNYEL